MYNRSVYPPIKALRKKERKKTNLAATFGIIVNAETRFNFESSDNLIISMLLPYFRQTSKIMYLRTLFAKPDQIPWQSFISITRYLLLIQEWK